MAGAFTAVDLSKLPFPAAVEELDFESILAALIADLQERDASYSALVESDPAYKILEVCAYREMLVRQRNNEAIKAVTLACAAGSDLDQIAARYNVERLTIVPAAPNAIPPTPAVMESDTELRRRVQLSFEGFSTAGPEGAYIFHALGADAQVLDVSVHAPTFASVEVSPEAKALLPEGAMVLQVVDDAGLADPMPGDVAIAVQSRDGAGEAQPELVATVAATLSSETVRPLTDHPRVRSATVAEYSVEAVLTFFPGPDREVVMQTALVALESFVERQHRLGRDVTLSGLYAALHQEGVQNVELIAPAAGIVVPWDTVAYCTGIDLTDGGTDE
ncbi:baseplate assembly protein [Desulfobulbus elongatus]|uniref:baseplate assembly protein n=1 Tax=Desulfobulbus elongatus TaxID=53332 RepID=UPI000557B604|nr:baseplate J/gp47 family protein [Desulfobulbus elongatus]